MADVPSDDGVLDALMARLADGDRAVFRAVYDHLRAPVERLCQTLLGSTPDAADAFQEAMQKIFERAPRDYDRRRPALPWALALAGWECRTVRKRRQRRRETGVQDDGAMGRASDDAEAALLEKELQEAARALLGTLSEADRETLRATFWDEAGGGDAATRKRRQRALGRLRDAFRRIYGLS